VYLSKKHLYEKALSLASAGDDKFVQLASALRRLHEHNEELYEKVIQPPGSKARLTRKAMQLISLTEGWPVRM
jgi:hypothetical protein